MNILKIKIVSIQVICLHWTMVRFSVCVAVRLVMLACGILTVAEQVYGPLSVEKRHAPQHLCSIEI